jgi:hypothetical protein
MKIQLEFFFNYIPMQNNASVVFYEYTKNQFDTLLSRCIEETSKEEKEELRPPKKFLNSMEYFYNMISSNKNNSEEKFNSEIESENKNDPLAKLKASIKNSKWKDALLICTHYLISLHTSLELSKESIRSNLAFYSVGSNVHKFNYYAIPSKFFDDLCSEFTSSINLSSNLPFRISSTKDLRKLVGK